MHKAPALQLDLPLHPGQVKLRVWNKPKGPCSSSSTCWNQAASSLGPVLMRMSAAQQLHGSFTAILCIQASDLQATPSPHPSPEGQNSNKLEHNLKLLSAGSGYGP